jgi:O-antigen/teichoic acid export membrane protein
MTLQNAFSKHILFLLLVNLVVKPTYLFIIEVGVQNSLGPKVYGLYFALFNLAYLFNVILDLGIQNQATHQLANDAETTEEKETILGLKLVLVITYLVSVLLTALIMGYRGV